MPQSGWDLVSPRQQPQGGKLPGGFDLPTITSWVCLVASVLTLLQGVIYLIAKMAELDLFFGTCGIFQRDCNVRWRAVFAFNHVILLDLWTPIILGCIGVAVHMKPSLKFTRITSYRLYAGFMLVTTLYGNFGYVGQFGILVGVFPLVGCLLCIITLMLGTKDLQQLELGPSFSMP